MESIAGELGFMASSAGKAFLLLMEPHRLMFLALGPVKAPPLGPTGRGLGTNEATGTRTFLSS